MLYRKPMNTETFYHATDPSWAVFHITGTPAKFLSIIDDAPNEKTAIERAIKEFQVPTNLRDRLMARRRD